MLSVEMVKCSVKVHIQKSSYQRNTNDDTQICLRYIYMITMKLGEETKQFPSCLCCVRVDKILKALLARNVKNKAEVGPKDSPWQGQVFW